MKHLVERNFISINCIGGAMFIHAFGAYFGLAVSMMHHTRNVKMSEKLEGSSYSSDIFSLVIMWSSDNSKE